jgi:hypothetical protein
MLQRLTGKMAPNVIFGAILVLSVLMGGPVPGLAVSPTISSLEPSRGSSGTMVTIHGSGFAADNTVHFGAGGSLRIRSANNGTLIYYKIPIAIGPCDLKRSPCQDNAARMLLPGVYPVYITNPNGESNKLEFTLLAPRAPG